ncbi:uncharacterized protein LOC121242963 isoform X2 [Juglans microcarpa x Juglans regia]|uniref:uncharacterized protein LOC121242963 isoform X2 n=1 Tax=Juglans microcarpa x Juglans regia TaxID=2249226 RepID=UPI001B7E65E1|nr:uncharacterized protein LOC121242963 isoform X2 [Juglans microcarpa x Juglans regia]
MAETKEDASFWRESPPGGDGASMSLGMKKRKRKSLKREKREFRHPTTTKETPTAVSSFILSGSASSPTPLQSHTHNPNLNLTHDYGISSYAHYQQQPQIEASTHCDSFDNPHVNLSSDFYNNTKDNHMEENNTKKKRKIKTSSSKKGVEEVEESRYHLFQEELSHDPPTNENVRNEIEEESNSKNSINGCANRWVGIDLQSPTNPLCKDIDLSSDGNIFTSSTGDSVVAENFRDDDRLKHVRRKKKKKKNKNNRGERDDKTCSKLIKSEEIPLSLQKFEDVLSRYIYEGNGGTNSLKKVRHNDEEEKKSSKEPTSECKMTKDSSILATERGRNLAGQVDSDAVLVPTIYTNLKEEVQRNGPGIGEAVYCKQRRVKGKQQTIAHLEVQNASPYFQRSTGQQVLTNDGNTTKMKSTGPHSETSAAFVKVSRYFQKMPEKEEGSDLVCDKQKKEPSCQNGLGIGDIDHSKRRGVIGKQQTIAHTKVRKASPYFQRSTGQQVLRNDGNDTQMKSTGPRSKTSATSVKVSRFFQKMPEKEEGSDLVCDRLRKESSRQIKSGVHPSVGKQILKLEDVLSQYIYKSNGISKKVKNGRHKGEEEKKYGEEPTSSSNMTNPSSIIAIDGGRNSAEHVDGEAVVAPRIYTNLKEEEMQQNGLGIEKVGSCKRRRGKEKQQTIAHPEVQKLSPYFQSSTGRQVLRNGSNDTQIKSRRPCAKPSATLVKVTSRFFKKMPGEEENADGILLGGKKTRKRSVKVKTVLSTLQKRFDAYRRKSPDNMWKPPRSRYGLLQEDHADDPWKVLVICMLLNRTTGSQAGKILLDLFTLCPDAKTATEVPAKEIEKIIQPLGLQKKRAQMIQRFSQDYMGDTWKYVTDLYGVDMQPMRMQYFVQESGTG